jgi:flagellar biosynthesis GTPase FlhF
VVTARRFIGNDLQRLYARVHREIGSEAIILGTRSLMREGGEPLIELLVAHGDGEDGLPFELQQAMVDSVLSHVNPSLTVGDLEDLVARDELGQEPGAATPPRPAVAADARLSFPVDSPAPASPPPSPRFRSAYAPSPPSPVHDVLVEAGFSEAAAEAVAEATPHETDPQTALAIYLQALPISYPGDGTTALITIQGPPGVGSTTALLRMALDCADAGREARLVAADGSHAGRREQLHTYGTAMGLQVSDAFDTPGLLRLVNRAPAGCCLFVDVGGMPWRPPAALASRHYGYLALPAHWSTRVLNESLRRIEPGGLCGAVPTFVDLTADLSPILSLIVETRLGIAFLSSGRDIATGITVADPFTIASGVFTMPTGDTTDGRLAVAG